MSYLSVTQERSFIISRIIRLMRYGRAPVSTGERRLIVWVTAKLEITSLVVEEGVQEPDMVVEVELLVELLADEPSLERVAMAGPGNWYLRLASNALTTIPGSVSE